MSNSLTGKINVYIAVDVQTINSYFNAHDPSPLYKKQINQKFENYILNSVSSAKRYSAIFYKLNCRGAVSRQYADSLMHAIKKHFGNKKAIRQSEFEKFKRRNFMLLALSGSIVIICEAFLPLIFKDIGAIYSGLKNCLDVFSWVILWKPIYELLFTWNSHLKEILLFKKLATAEVIITDEKKNEAEKISYNDTNNNEVEVSDTLSFESLLSH